MHSGFDIFSKRIQSRWTSNLFFLFKLPMAFLSGLRVIQISRESCAVSIRYKWINQNPFQSVYFAAQLMAAELSTGALAFGQLYQRKPSASMLVLSNRSVFHKKVKGKLIFTCSDGAAIEAAIENTIQTGEPVTVECYAAGVTEEGVLATECWFTWTFRAKK